MALRHSDYNTGLIYTDVTECIDCNKCIHECPVLTANVSVPGNDGKHKMCVDEHECVLCGICLDTCIHDVRRFRDDCDDFLTDLKRGGKEFSVLVAPAFFLNYPGQYNNVLGYLKSLGVKNFYPVSFGADIAVWGYLKFLSQGDAKSMITQPCPCIVSHIEKHKPELIDSIVPVQSPMMCTAIYLKRYLGIEEELVFLSPCIAKKTEMQSKRGLGLITHNVTFKNLMQHVEQQGVNLSDYHGVEVELDYGMGSLFPQPGGLGENLTYYLGPEAAVIQVEGEQRIYGYLESFAARTNKRGGAPLLVEALNCLRGCSFGTGTDSCHTDENEIALEAIAMRKKKYCAMKDSNQSALLSPSDRLARLNDKFKDLNLDHFLCEYENNYKANDVTDAEIEAIFAEKLHKLTDNEQHMDCSACGYNTCRQMAEAIALGINHHNNCVYYLKNAVAENFQITQQRLEAMLDASPLLCVIFDENFKPVEVNEEAVRLLKLAHKQEYIEKYHELLPEKQPCGSPSHEKADIELSKAFLEGSSYIAEWIYMASDGEQIPVEVFFECVKLEGKNVVLEYARDLRPVKTAIKLTLEANETFRKFLSASPMLIEVWDSEYNLVECNQQALEHFGVDSIDEYIERFHEYLPTFQPCGTPSMEIVTTTLERAFTIGHARHEFLHVSPLGEPMPIEVHLERIERQGEKIVVCYAHDLRNMKNTLEKLQEEEKLRERIEEESQTKTRFLAQMSHEIRTPISAVLGVAEIALMRENLSAEDKDSYQRIHRSAGLLLGIINDILDLSKAATGKMEVIPDSYGSLSLIADVVQLNTVFLGEKNVKFMLEIDENLYQRMIGDELRIKQIINNILSNALKYTERGMVKLFVGIEDLSDDEHVMLIIKISDTGAGMSKEQISGLFDEFVRFNQQRNRNIEGTGLGMSITYMLTKLMQGELEVESEQGKGTTVIIRIPQKPDGIQVIGRDAAIEMRNINNLQKHSKEVGAHVCEPMPYGRVLVVDDVESNLHVAKGFLQAYKLAVDTAESGYKVIEKIDAGEVYDIIFMDHMMPELDGVKTTEIIKGKGYDLPIVALTADAIMGQEDHFIEMGFNGFISKPIVLKQLDDCLIRLIRDKQPPETIDAARKEYGMFSGENKIDQQLFEEVFLDDAKNVLSALEAIIAQEEEMDSNTVKNYIVHIHGIKTALRHIGNVELSEVAETLENAGKGADLASIKANTPSFLNNLRDIIKKFDTD